MNWIVIHPEQVIALRDDPHFVSAEQYPAGIDLVPGELGCLLREDRVPIARFVIPGTVLPAGVMVSDYRPRTTMVVPLNGLPEVPSTNAAAYNRAVRARLDAMPLAKVERAVFAETATVLESDELLAELRGSGTVWTLNGRVVPMKEVMKP